MDRVSNLFRRSVVTAAVTAMLPIASALPFFAQAAFADAPTCQGQTATIYVDTGVIVGGPDDGQAYASTLNGTGGDDVIVGTVGNDVINGNGGTDTICAGDGA